MKNGFGSMRQEQRLTGIILLDTDGSVQCEYNGDLLNFLTLQEYIERDTVLDVVRYPQKTYASRIDLRDGLPMWIFRRTAVQMCPV